MTDLKRPSEFDLVKASATLPGRLWGYIDKTPGQGPQGDCWCFKGYRNRQGYGRIGVGPPRGTTVLAHRALYILEVGPIPAGLLVCHSCDNPPCCNPDHLFPGTVKDNQEDMSRKGRGRKTAKPTHEAEDPLLCFLYLLSRDRLRRDAIEGLVEKTTGGVVVYSDAGRAIWAARMADKIRAL